MITIDMVRRALRDVADPCAIATGVPVDVVAMGLVQDIRIDGDDVVVGLRVTSPFCLQIGLITEQARAAVGRLPGVGDVRVEADPAVEWLPEDMEPAARDALRRVRPLPLAGTA